MIRAAIVGGTGYTGVELLRLLVQHPEVEVTAITSRSEVGLLVADMYPSLRGHLDLAFTAPDAGLLSEMDVVFFATPHAVAMNMMPEIVATGVKVVDLSADFRIKDIPLWEKWYGVKHSCPELVEQAVYGLPEINREQVKTAHLVACPGCYPTSIQLGFLPLLEQGLVDVESLIASSASGVSGAGRQAKVANLLAEVSDSFKAYGVSGHRHLPEIEQGLALIANSAVQLTFVPHLLPTLRGIHSTLYANLARKGVDLQALYQQRYADEPFVDVLGQGVYPETRTVRGVNTCRISVEQPQQRDTVVVMSVIDNLVKGASGQAVQNMNLMFGLAETAGLDTVALIP